MKRLVFKKYRPDRGKHCFINRGLLNDKLAYIYGRDPAKTCLRIFDDSEVKEAEDLLTVKWGDDPKLDTDPKMNTTLFEATQIQNICSWWNLAPRIYGLETAFVAGKYRPVQICEYIEGLEPTHEKAIEIYELVKTKGIPFGFGNDKDDVNVHDVIGTQLVDFNTFRFKKPYEETVKESYIKEGKYGKVYYQDEPQLGLRGAPRKSEKRIEYMKLSGSNFAGKNVLDVGCAGGYFLRYAVDHGARRVLGLDTPTMIGATRAVNNLLGYFNIDILASGEDGDFNFPAHDIDKFDVVFFLSMYMHIGFPDSILDRMEKDSIMIFEKNGRQTDEEVFKYLKTKFDNVTLLGSAEDHGDKPIYLCQGKS